MLSRVVLRERILTDTELKVQRVRLYPENSRSDNIFIGNRIRQGVTVKALKDLN